METIYDASILLVDDEAELRRMVEGILRREGFSRILSAGTCRETREQLRAHAPDCAVLDVMLPDGDGFELLRELRRSSDIPVLFLSARDEDESRLLGLGLGADDYLTKPFLPRELTLRLSAHLRRAYFPVTQGKSAPKPVFRLGDREVDFNSGVVRKGGESVSLTAKEYALIWKLYENRGNIVTLDSLCRAAWDDGLFGYENTLMVHIRRLREKLEPEPSKPRYLLTARGLGYKLAREEEA